DRLNQADRANARYALVTVDYLNSYYGRLAESMLKQRGIAPERRHTLANDPKLSALLPIASAAAAPLSTANISATPAAATDATSAGSAGDDPAGLTPTSTAGSAAATQTAAAA